MRRLLALLFLCWCSGVAAAPRTPAALQELVVLSYHDVREVLPASRDPYVMEAAELVNQFAWLKENGYTPVSLQQVLDAREGKAALPAKPVLLTFDDGYRSFYTHVLPLLQLFGYPAVLALVGQWTENPTAGVANAPAHAPLLTWDEVRAVMRSGLVEIASHSHDLHRGVRANPQGNELAAATTRIYDPKAQRYEGDAAWETRVQADLRRSATLIEERVGVRPRAIVWPYGSYTVATRRLAREVGLVVSIGLDDERPSTYPFGLHLGRSLIVGNPSLREFTEELLRPYQPDPVRAVRVDLGEVYDPDFSVQEANLSRLLDRIAALGVNTVYLRASADTDADGYADAAWFPSRNLPMRADLFGRAAWQLHSRAGVEVFAWLPARDFRWKGQGRENSLDVHTGHSPFERRENSLHAGSSPFKGEDRRGMGSESAPSDADERRRIAETWQDLARYAFFDGLLFDDGGSDDGADATAFHAYLVRAVSVFRDPVYTARALRLDAVPARDDARAQALTRLARSYDQVLLRVQRAGDAQGLTDVARSLSDARSGFAGVVWEVDAPAATLPATLRALQLRGIADLGYAGDDFRRDRPPLHGVRPVMSLQSQPR